MSTEACNAAQCSVIIWIESPYPYMDTDRPLVQSPPEKRYKGIISVNVIPSILLKEEARKLLKSPSEHHYIRNSILYNIEFILLLYHCIHYI